jgi:hypothetical protein
MKNRFSMAALLGVLSLGAAACNDNAEDHNNEAAEEARSGDTEEAAEERS